MSWADEDVALEPVNQEDHAKQIQHLKNILKGQASSGMFAFTFRQLLRKLEKELESSRRLRRTT